MNNDLDRRLLLGTAGLAGIAALAAASKAGPLNPPAGAVASTGKTLDQVEPRKVIEDVPVSGGFRTLTAGAWKLTGNYAGAPLRIPPGTDIDLCGFTLSPAGGSSGGVAIQYLFASAARVAVRNGRIVGTVFPDANPDGALLENLEFTGLVGVFANSVVRNCRWKGGFLVVGARCIVEDCVIEPTSDVALALDASSECLLRRVIVTGRVGEGINTNQNCVIESCVVTNSGGAGITVGPSSVARDCCVEATGVGMRAFAAAVLAGCTVGKVTGLSEPAVTARFQLSGQCVVESCIATEGSEGFICGEDAVLRNCTAFENTGAGFSCTGAGTSFDGCTSRSNGGIGFALSNSSRIERCLSVANAGGGYRVTSDCLVRGNHADSNTGIAFLATSSDNRVEGNSVADGGGTSIGIQVDVAGNLVIGNSVSGVSTPYAILAGNAAGPIVNTAGVATNTVTTANFSF